MSTTEALGDEGTAKDGMLYFKLGFVAMLLGVLIINLANLSYPPLDRTVFAVFAVFVALPFLGFVYVKRRKARGAKVGHLLRCNAFLLFAPLLWALVVFANGGLDRSPSQAHTSILLKKKESKGKGGTRYLFEVSSWRRDQQSESIDVKDKMFERLQAGDPVIVETCHGLFGIVWVKSISVVK
jgi:hypothetical protein